MVKRLIQGLLLGLLAVHFNAYALGLGSIQLNSALNQPLSAEIELLSTTPEDADSIQVSLASYETFAKVGIDRPSVLALMRYKVTAKGRGYVIKIDSHDPIREPFLDFILEVNWSSGRVLREYTLLLDPPELKKAQPAQIMAPAAQTVTEVQKRVATPAVTVPAQAKAASSGLKLAGTISATEKGGISYGPVRNGETLWSIAKEMRSGASVSTQQMLMALLEENPNAFIAGDINRLKRGSILRLNNPAIVGSISRQESMTEVAQRSQPSAMRKPADMDEQLMNAASAEAKRPSLKLVTPDSKSSSDKMGATVPEGSGSDALRQELMMALEISEAQRNENEALKERMSDLQKQLDALKRLVTLKDGDLAQIQQQFAESRDMAESMPVVEAPVAAALVEPITEELPEVVTTTTEQAPSSLVIPDEPVVEETIADALMQEQKSAVVVAPEVTTPKVAPLPKPIPAPIIKPAAEPDFISSVISDPMFMTAGGATLALILLLLLLMIKKRGNRFHESILSGDASSMGASTIGGPDTSFLSDLAISGLAGGGMESDEGEVDPLTEADVYMAYGRTKQAESLLKDALKSNPDRLELKSKLLEVYFTAKDKDKFDAIIADSSEQLQKDDAAWKKILIMGHELSPENLLFAEAPEEDGAEDDLLDFAEGDDTVFDDVLDIGIDLDELSAEMESASGDDLDFDLGLDFSDLDNDIFSTSSESADKKSADSQTEDEESFDLSELDIDGAQEEVLDTPLAAIEASDETADDGGLDFNLEEFELDDSSTTNKQSGKSVLAATTGPDDDSGIDFTLDDLDLESADESDLSAELDDELSSIDGDLDDIGDLSDLTGDEDLADVGDLSDLSIDIEDDDLDSIDLELLDAAEADETDAVSEEQAIELDTSDLDLLADDEASEISDAPITADSLDIDTDKPEKSGELVIDDDSMDLDDFDFDFDSVQSDEIDEVVQSAVELDSDIGLELSDSDESTAETTDELDDFDLEFDIADDDSLDADGFDELDLDVDDIELDTNDGDMDTKIDLAKAYIEMGDADGARHMLDEVVSQGDASQKQQAQDLLDSI